MTDLRWLSLNEQRPARPAPPPPPVVGRRTVILTGGADVFAGLYARGDRILVLGSQFSAGQRAAAADPTRVALRYTDLRDPTTLPTAAELAAFLLGTEREAVLVHAAATVEPAGPVGTLDGFDIDTAVHVNVLTPMWLTNLFLGAVPPGLDHLRVVFVTTRATSATGRATTAAVETFLRGLDSDCAVEIVEADLFAG